MEKIRIVAEIAQAHEGSLGIAHSLIDSAKKAGATDVKFQMHFAEEESSNEDKFRINSFPQDKNRYSYWKRMEFSLLQWKELFKHCREIEINPIVSPFSHKAIELCNELGISSLKIGSGETSNIPLIKHAASKASEIILSTGMSGWLEIDNAIKEINFLEKKNLNIIILQCTSKYPTNLEEIGIENIKSIFERYKLPSGLSDHSGKLSPSLAAVSQGYTSMVEIHITYSKECFGPDSKSSLEILQFKQLVELIRETEILISNKVDKDVIPPDIKKIKLLFSRSMFAKVNIPKGTKFNKEMIIYKKPGGGLNFNQEDLVIGKRSKFNIEKGDLISEDQIL
tara:strand:+ start:1591 stop:2607 length:1017 start_codon:yes stop_codon:yes gene_type:complete